MSESWAAPRPPAAASLAGAESAELEPVVPFAARAPATAPVATGLRVGEGVRAGAAAAGLGEAGAGFADADAGAGVGEAEAGVGADVGVGVGVGAGVEAGVGVGVGGGVDEAASVMNVTWAVQAEPAVATTVAGPGSSGSR